MQSHSVTVKPLDPRCRYWAKVLRAGDPLPLPSNVEGANDIPGRYLQLGEEELLPGDVLLEGEANHHRNARGWTYWVTFVRPNGALVHLTSGFSVQKKAFKAQGMPPELLTGSGDIAAMVRIAHAVRLGLRMSIPSQAAPEKTAVEPEVPAEPA